ncbi:MAG: DUF3575 domain-containing protein [Myxococcales bacterium]|nr:DUF3575 domain-containing protein [Myxococcales bacterium]
MMNRTTAVFLAALLFGGAGQAFAQDDVEAAESAPVDDRPLNTITIDPLPLIFGVLSLEYERAVAPAVSIYAGPSINFGTSVDDPDSAFGLGLDMGARFFPWGKAPEGFFIAADFGVAYASATDGETDTSASAVAYAVGGSIGYTFLIADVFDLSLGVGAQYADFEIKVANDSIGFSGVLPTLRLALGAAF